MNKPELQFVFRTKTKYGSDEWFAQFHDLKEYQGAERPIAIALLDLVPKEIPPCFREIVSVKEDWRKRRNSSMTKLWHIAELILFDGQPATLEYGGVSKYNWTHLPGGEFAFKCGEWVRLPREETKAVRAAPRGLTTDLCPELPLTKVQIDKPNAVLQRNGVKCRKCGTHTFNVFFRDEQKLVTEIFTDEQPFYIPHSSQVGHEACMRDWQ